MPRRKPQPEPLLKPAEVAAELRVSLKTVYRYIAAGELPSVAIGPRGYTRISRAALNAYIAKRTRLSA
jgi:excisionase family DNA binding protein